MSENKSGRPVAWLTGASRGMGADTAVQFARAGYDVAITARDEHKLSLIAEEVHAAGGRAFVKTSDITQRSTLHAFADAALAELGRCDVLCNIAIYQGKGGFELLMDTDLDEIAISYEADVIAAVLLSQRAISDMRTRGKGTIISMSSATVFMDPPGDVHNNGWSFAYVAAKAALDRLASIINVELGREGIRAFTVEPGFVAWGDQLQETLKRYPGLAVSPPESIGPAIVWLVDNPAAANLMTKRVNLPGLTQKNKLLPGWDGPGTNFKSMRSK